MTRKKVTADTPDCSITDCGRKALNSRGWCNAHYLRWRRHGDPTAGKPSPAARGEPREWMRRHLTHQGGECLLWPFGRTGAGYGAIYDNGPQQLAHRWVCEQVNGPAPTASHEAAHTCGNGHLGCVHPGHLYWGTGVENAADRDCHGRTPKGERHPHAKLTNEDVLEIYALRGRQSARAVAKQFGVAAGTVSWIWTGRSWSWLTGDHDDKHRATRRAAFSRRALSRRSPERLGGLRSG